MTENSQAQHTQMEVYKLLVLPQVGIFHQIEPVQSFRDEQRVDLPADPELCEALLKACESLADTTVLKGRIATGDQFISDTEKRLALGKEFNALACEMEGGAVGHTCYRNKVPFAILRCISDDLTNSTSMDYESFKAFAANKTTTVLSQFIKEM